MVDSPCIAICKLKNDLCIGCYRTVDEITVWRDSSDEEKRYILKNIEKRKAAYLAQPNN
jgi:predicted Fe-S protein YdhL (DUF1289 family)